MLNKKIKNSNVALFLGVAFGSAHRPGLEVLVLAGLIRAGLYPASRLAGHNRIFGQVFTSVR